MTHGHPGQRFRRCAQVIGVDEIFDQAYQMVLRWIRMALAKRTLDPCNISLSVKANPFFSMLISKLEQMLFMISIINRCSNKDF